jgi:hypothetical protein
MDIYGQAYDTKEYDISKTTDWNVYFNTSAASSPDITVGVDILEADGTVIVKSASTQPYTGTGSGMQTLTWTSAGSPVPPSNTIGNITHRRLRVTFSRNSGSLTITYDGANPTYDSRLAVGTIVPERSIYFGLIIPFLPPVVRWYQRRRKRTETEQSLLV